MAAVTLIAIANGAYHIYLFNNIIKFYQFFRGDVITALVASGSSGGGVSYNIG